MCVYINIPSEDAQKLYLATRKRNNFAFKRASGREEILSLAHSKLQLLNALIKPFHNNTHMNEITCERVIRLSIESESELLACDE